MEEKIVKVLNVMSEYLSIDSDEKITGSYSTNVCRK